MLKTLRYRQVVLVFVLLVAAASLVACSSGITANSTQSSGISPAAVGRAPLAITRATLNTPDPNVWDGAYMSAAFTKSGLVVEQNYITTRTMIRQRDLLKDSTLAAEVNPANVFEMEDNIANVTSLAQPPTPAPLIMYNIEKSGSTPVSERQHPIPSIQTAEANVHSAGLAFGVSPTTGFLGITSNCTFNFSNSLLNQIDFSNIQLLNLQVQFLASDAHCGVGNATAFQSYVQQAATLARKQNPNIKIVAEVSLNSSSPQNALNAIASVQGIADLVRVSYNTNNCIYCKPQDFQQVISALVPSPSPSR